MKKFIMCRTSSEKRDNQRKLFQLGYDWSHSGDIEVRNLDYEGRPVALIWEENRKILTYAGGYDPTSALDYCRRRGYSESPIPYSNPLSYTLDEEEITL